jgi:hypothetical protein
MTPMADKSDKADKATDEQAAGQKQAEESALEAQRNVDDAVRKAGAERLPSLGGPNLPEEG